MITRRALLLAASAYPCSPAVAGRRQALPAPIPPGYVAMGQRHGVPPIVLYGVALQESKQLFGRHALPYPWTLNVARKPMRFASYGEAVDALRRFVGQGVLSIDCGLLQVNWFYHREKLGSFWSALDPYPNIAAGARLLRDHFSETKSWFRAVANYHNRKPEIGTPYAESVYRLMAQVPASTAAKSHG